MLLTNSLNDQQLLLRSVIIEKLQAQFLLS